MNKLEPTYLRYVYDGLHKGSLNAENASALPQGFIGLFESEFPADISSVERISILRRLTLWALFKGAVSTHLASEVLEEDEEDTKTLIDTYSKWFNSPEPGKYILYHDRLRSYFLQKLSSHEVQSLNEKLISYLEAALEENRVDKAQEYALEHLATHMAVESQLDNNYDRLHEFVNQEDIWKRQVRASKEYKWSQQAVQLGIKEGARRHHEMNTLTSTVNSVKLMQEEQNSTQQILDLLNEGDYQTALERALSFNGEKLFTIYLLMIHELTIGTSKQVAFKLDACKAVLKAIEEEELSVPSTFPKLVIYKYHLELTAIGLDDEVLWDKMGLHDDYILELLGYENIDLEVIIKLSRRQVQNIALIYIYQRIAESYFKKDDLAKQSKDKYTNNINYRKRGLDILEELIEIINQTDSTVFEKFQYDTMFTSGGNKEDTCLNILEVLFSQQAFSIGHKVAQLLENLYKEQEKREDSIDTMPSYTEEYLGSVNVDEHANQKLSLIYIKLGDSNEGLNRLNKVQDHYLLSEKLIEIAVYYINQGKIKLARDMIERIPDIEKKINGYFKISKILLEKGSSKFVEEIVYKDLEEFKITKSTSVVDMSPRKDIALMLFELYMDLNDKKNADIIKKQAINLCRLRIQTIHQCRSLIKVACTLFKYNQKEESYDLVQEVIDTIKQSKIIREDRYRIIRSIPEQLVYMGRIDLVIDLHHNELRLFNSSIPSTHILHLKSCTEKINDSNSLLVFNLQCLNSLIEYASNERFTTIEGVNYYPEMFDVCDCFWELNDQLLSYEYIYNDKKRFLKRKDGLDDNNYWNTIYDQEYNSIFNYDDDSLSGDQVKLPLISLRSYLKTLQANKIELIERKDPNIKDIQKKILNEFSTNEIFNLDKEISSLDRLEIPINTEDSIKELLKSNKMTIKEISKALFFNNSYIKIFLDKLIDKNEIKIDKENKYSIYTKENNIEEKSVRADVSAQLYKLTEYKNGGIDIDKDLPLDEQLSSYLGIISGLDISKEKVQIKKLLYEALEISKKIENQDSIEIYLNEISIYLAKVGDIEFALDIARSIMKKLTKAEAMCDIALFLIDDLTLRNKVKDILIEAFDYAVEQKYMIDLRSAVYSKIILQLIELGECKIALDLATKGSFEFKSLSSVPLMGGDDFDKYYDAYFSIGFALIQHNRLQEGFQVVNLMVRLDKILDFHLDYINLLIEENNKTIASNHLSGRINIVDDLPDFYKDENFVHIIKPYLCLKIASIYKKLDLDENAVKFVDLAFRSIIRCEDNASYLEDICHLYIKEGDLEKAIAVLDYLTQKFKNKEYEYTIWVNGAYRKKQDILFKIISNLIDQRHQDAAINIALSYDLRDFSVISKRYSINKNLELGILHQNKYFTNALSQKFLSEICRDNEEYIYLNNFYSSTVSLPNILFHKAKIECFFEKEPDEEKLNLLSQVIDIDEWRKISASI